jgi:hypothetical protein
MAIYGLLLVGVLVEVCFARGKGIGLPFGWPLHLLDYLVDSHYHHTLVPLTKTWAFLPVLLLRVEQTRIYPPSLHRFATASSGTVDGVTVLHLLLRLVISRCPS